MAKPTSRPGGDGGLRRWCLGRAFPAFAAGAFILLLATVANVAAALLFRPLFDEGVLGRQGWVLVPIVAAQVALFLARGVLAGVAFDLLARASARLGYDLSLRIFDHMSRQPLSYFLDQTQARLLQLLRNDVVVLELNLGQTLGQAMVATLQTAVTLLVIVAWEPRLAALCLVGLGAGAALIWLASRLTNRALGSEIAASETVAEHLLTLLGPRGFLLRASAAPGWGRGRLERLLDRYRSLLVRRRVIPNWVMVAGEGVSTATYFCFYLAGAFLVAGGSVSTGSLIALAALVSYLIGSMNQLAPTYVSLGEAWLRLGRMENELAGAPPPSHGGGTVAPASLRGAFELKGVTVRYRDAIALDGVSAVIRPGRIAAVAGRSGAGKTTLTLLLLGLIEAEAGTVTLDGLDINRYRRDALWGGIGYVPQEPVLFHGTARENIELGRPIAPDDIVAVAEEVGIHHRLAAAAGGYDADLGENGFRLSGGERRRISLARAIAGRPSVLVLDEPTAGLDAVTDTLVHKLMVDRRAAGDTVIVVTHNRATLALADDVIVLDQGRLVCSGSVNDAAVAAQLAALIEVTRAPQLVI